MQEQASNGPTRAVQWDEMPGQSLAALLALVGTKRMGVDSLMVRARLTPTAFADLLNWLREERLVDLVSSPEEGQVRAKVELTDRGESVLLALLERTCELPEFR